MLWRVRTFPDFCEPCLPSQIERPPAGNDWIHEIKHDGFRLLARRGAERVRLFTRNGNDWSERFPLIVEALNALEATTCLLDGEAVTCSEAGVADFDGLRNRRGDVHLCAFDLVELDGRDLRLEPLTTRRRLLARLIRKPRWELVLNALFEQDGPLVFEHACLLGCEGIVSKRKDSPYRSGRSRHWVKSKNPDRTGGQAGSRRGLGKREMAINYRSHFTYRIDAWDADGENVIEHLAGVEDPQVAKATYLAACQRWPGTPITLRQGTRVMEDSRRTRLA